MHPRTVREDWQLHLKQARDELGLGGVRYHVRCRCRPCSGRWHKPPFCSQGIFDDDMQVVTGPREYNWTLIDQSWDYQVGLGLTPVVELSFMPVRPFSLSPILVHSFMPAHLLPLFPPAQHLQAAA